MTQPIPGLVLDTPSPKSGSPSSWIALSKKITIRYNAELVALSTALARASWLATE